MSGRNTARIDGAPKQLSLDLGMLPQRSKRMPASSCRDVLFFAVVPAPAAAACIAQRAEGLQNQYGLRGRRRPTELLHVTLHPVGSYLHLPNDILSAGIQVGSSVEVAPFEVTFDRVSSFRGTDRHPLALRCGDGIAELVTLQKEPRCGHAKHRAGAGRSLRLHAARDPAVRSAICAGGGHRRADHMDRARISPGAQPFMG